MSETDGQDIINQSWNLLCPFPDWAWDAIQQFRNPQGITYISQKQSIVILLGDRERKSWLYLDLVSGPGSLALFPDPRSMSFINTEDNIAQPFPESVINAKKAVKHLGINASQSNLKIRWRLGPTSGGYYDGPLPPLQGDSLGGTFALLLAGLLAQTTA